MSTSGAAAAPRWRHSEPRLATSDDASATKTPPCQAMNCHTRAIRQETAGAAAGAGIRRSRQPELREAVRGRLLVAKSLCRRPGRQVDRRLGIRRQDQERPAGLDGGHRALCERQRKRARKPTRVHGRHNRIVNSQPYALAAVFGAGEVERLYSGLSVVVSAAADGERTAALVGFGALEL